MMLYGIAAMGQNRQIGLKGDLPWRNKIELQHFKNQTQGHILIMGRKTFDSIPGTLKGRKTIVISKTKRENDKYTFFVKSPEEAIELAKFIRQDGQKVWVCGGESIYKHFLPDIHTMLISVMEYDGEADACFPPFEQQFEQMSMENHVIGKYRVYEWKRVKNG